jgi:hypothetical protein
MTRKRVFVVSVITNSLRHISGEQQQNLDHLFIEHHQYT